MPWLMAALGGTGGATIGAGGTVGAGAGLGTAGGLGPVAAAPAYMAPISVPGSAGAFGSFAIPSSGPLAAGYTFPEAGTGLLGGLQTVGQGLGQFGQGLTSGFTNNLFGNATGVNTTAANLGRTFGQLAQQGMSQPSGGKGQQQAPMGGPDTVHQQRMMGALQGGMGPMMGQQQLMQLIQAILNPQGM